MTVTTSGSSALTLWWPGSGLLCSGTVWKSSAALSKHLPMATVHTCLRTEGTEGGAGIGPWMGLYRTIPTSPIFPSLSRGFHLMTLLMGTQSLSLWIWSYPVSCGLVSRYPTVRAIALILSSLLALAAFDPPSQGRKYPGLPRQKMMNCTSLCAVHQCKQSHATSPSDGTDI